MRLSSIELAYLAHSLTQQIGDLRQNSQGPDDEVYMAELILLRQKIRDERNRKAAGGQD